MLFLLEGQPQNLLTFSGQIDVKHYVREKLTFLMLLCHIQIVRQRKSNAQKYSEPHIQYPPLCHYFNITSLASRNVRK